MKKFAMPAIILIALVGVVAFVRGGIGGRKAVHYPFVCKECHAVMDYSEFAASPDKWRVPKGAPSDSVVICLHCNKGWAYPVKTCDACSTRYIMYLTKDPRCPKCFPPAAAAAQKAGVDVIYHDK